MFKYLKSSIYTLCILIGSTIIITILNYFNILMGNVLKITELLIPIISIFIGSYILGKSSNNKGYIEGLKYGVVWIILFLIINLISKNFTYLSLIYYLILIIIAIVSSIIGINRRKN
ncbi:MAG: TIGR04086 family membrane protein [Bacilli bacterium]|nr:TIGR04086 family membrane protein [Bacilli bacterium]